MIIFSDYNNKIDPRLLLGVILITTAYLFLETSVTKLTILFLIIFLLLLIRNSHVLRYLLYACLLTGIFLIFIFIVGHFIFLIFSINELFIMYIRIINVTILYTLFYKEITPENLTKGLMFFKVPYKQAWTVSTAYRYIFLLINESKELKNALIIKGIPLDGNLIDKLRNLPVVVSLMVFRTNFLAIKLSEALFAKNWSPFGQKTFFHPLRVFNRVNIIPIIMFLIVLFNLYL